MMTHPFPDIHNTSEEDQKVIPGGSLKEELPLALQNLEKLLGITETIHHVTFRFVEIILVNEMEIIEINRKYLEKEYVTDIISFNYSEELNPQCIEGTLFCCLPRISEQSREFGVTVQSEFARIFVHGLLHLASYEDDSPKKKEQMTAYENEILKLAGIES